MEHPRSSSHTLSVGEPWLRHTLMCLSYVAVQSFFSTKSWDFWTKDEYLHGSKLPSGPLKGLRGPGVIFLTQTRRPK